MTLDPHDPLHQSALRVTAGDPRFVGHWLARHRVPDGLSDDQLAARLGTDLGGLALLALCRTPREASFAEDVDVIAARTGVSPTAVANLIREEQGLAAWAEAAAAGPVEAGAGWMIAAHDADQPPPGDDDDDAPVG